MWPPPDDQTVAARMRTAHQHARTVLGVHAIQHSPEAWGWRGRTLGQPVATPDGHAWLRLAATTDDQLSATFWNGAHAAQVLPASIPRPRLRRIHDWNAGPWRYRAELYDHIDDPPASTMPAVTTDPDLPHRWWPALRTALDDLGTVRTSRYTIQQGYLDWAMPTFLGVQIDTTVRSWTTAHGDLHLANLCAPTLTILDWEGWGLAPTGYDAAMLHTYSLLTPTLTARIRHEFAHVLDTPAGRFAELVTITELLHTTTHGDNVSLTTPLRARATHLLRVRMEAS